jgi:TPR repeat protein
MARVDKVAPSKRAWAELGAAQGERSGLSVLGRFLCTGVGGAVDKERARVMSERAALLGCKAAMLDLWREKEYPQEVRYRWLARAAIVGHYMADAFTLRQVFWEVERGLLEVPGAA